jgi:hypothetical protein
VLNAFIVISSKVLDGNTIRDHTGPGVYAINLPKQSTKFIEGERQEYSRCPIITSMNFRRNNNKGVSFPEEGLPVFLPDLNRTVVFLPYMGQHPCEAQYLSFEFPQRMILLKAYTNVYVFSHLI